MSEDIEDITGWRIKARELKARLASARERLDRIRTEFSDARRMFLPDYPARPLADCGDPTGAPVAVHPLSGVARVARDWRPIPSATIIPFPVERARPPAC